jgi:outer membrane protein TolC
MIPSLRQTLKMSLAVVCLGASLAFSLECSADEDIQQSSPLTTQPLTLSEAETAALTNNPSLAELQARIASSRALSIQAGELPDPKLGLGLVNVPAETFRLDDEPMTQILVGLSQTFPYPGTLDLRQELELNRSRSLSWEKKALRAELTRQVRRTWLEGFFQDRALEVIEENLSLFQELLTIARNQYSVGQGLQQDILLAQLERDRLLDDRARLSEARERTDSRLAELMAAKQSEYDLPETVPELPWPPSQQRMLAQLKKHPLIQAEQSRVERQKTAADLARKEYYPDFGLEVSYGHRRAEEPDGDRRSDFISARLSVDLPVFPKNRQDRRLEAARQEAIAAERKRDSLRLSLTRRIREQWSALKRTRQRAELFAEVIIPESEQTVQADTAAYMTGKLGFLELVRARLRTFEHQLSLWRLRIQAKQARADLLFLAQGGDES